jgi:hypothetical protein
MLADDFLEASDDRRLASLGGIQPVNMSPGTPGTQPLEGGADGGIDGGAEGGKEGGSRPGSNEPLASAPSSSR